VLVLPPPGASRRQIAGRLGLLAAGVVALADPLGGNGRNAVTATLRALALLALFVAGPRLVAAERRRRGTTVEVGDDGDVPADPAAASSP
jgi:hypothetical protein